MNRSEGEPKVDFNTDFAHTQFFYITCKGNFFYFKILQTCLCLVAINVHVP